MEYDDTERPPQVICETQDEKNFSNTHYFEAKTMKEMYNKVEIWQIQNEKRLQSLQCQRSFDHNENVCCIGITGPNEVLLCDTEGSPLRLVKPLFGKGPLMLKVVKY